MSAQLLKCDYAGRCGGCAWWDRTRDRQVEAKLAWAKKLFPDVTLKRPMEAGLRDRADLVWQDVRGEMRLGMYAWDVHEVTDLAACPMFSEGLSAWFHEFRRKAPPIQKGSVRLRVSPSGERGVWLDFANADVKNLFEEREYLRWLSERAFVEIGQRRKHLVWVEGAPKLKDPELHAWFETYDAQGGAIPLYGPVGGFSQVGFQVNRVLVDTVVEAVKKTGVDSWLELFCGNGNFLLALAARGFAVEGVELDPLALEGLEKSMRSEWRERVKFSRSDVYLKSKALPDLSARGLLVDPPRSGLREVLGAIEAGSRPGAIVYVSCFNESFAADAEKLRTLGYRLTSLQGVDQFPHTSHGEWVGIFQL